MKLIREQLYEKFSEKSDPIRDLGIGAPWEKLKKGSIIKCIKFTQTSKTYSPGGKEMYTGQTIYNKPRHNWRGNMFYEGESYRLIDDVKKLENDKLQIYVRNIKHGNGYDKITATPKQLSSRFEIIKMGVNEKFTDESDPIRDMNIGMKSKLTQYQLNHMLNFIRVKIDDVEKIKNFFGPSLEDIYWLGDTSLETRSLEYYKNIDEIIRTKNLSKKRVMNADFIWRKMGRIMKNVCLHYDTSEGKFFTMEYNESGRIETTYFGDLQAAISAEVLQHKIFDQL